ncbi:hypothetical protein C8J56DRAFT_510812 [Mycena floridula]|nr:hypothetical protein C8J56DRAFT_510812 [Mycena floridula]
MVLVQTFLCAGAVFPAGILSIEIARKQRLYFSQPLVECIQYQSMENLNSSTRLASFHSREVAAHLDAELNPFLCSRLLAVKICPRGSSESGDAEFPKCIKEKMGAVSSPALIIFQKIPKRIHLPRPTRPTSSSSRVLQSLQERCGQAHRAYERNPSDVPKMPQSGHYRTTSVRPRGPLPRCPPALSSLQAPILYAAEHSRGHQFQA